MVAPNRVVVNKFFTIPLAILFNTSMFTLPSVKEMKIDDDTVTRGRTIPLSKSTFRSFSMSSSTSLITYHD